MINEKDMTGGTLIMYLEEEKLFVLNKLLVLDRTSVVSSVESPSIRRLYLFLQLQ